MSFLEVIRRAWVDSVTEPDGKTFCPVRLTWLVSFASFLVFSFWHHPTTMADLLTWVQAAGVILGAGGVTAAIKDRAGFAPTKE